MTDFERQEFLEAIQTAEREDCKIITIDAFGTDSDTLKEMLQLMQEMGYTTSLEFDSDFNVYSIKFDTDTTSPQYLQALSKRLLQYGSIKSDLITEEEHGTRRIRLIRCSGKIYYHHMFNGEIVEIFEIK